MLVSVILSMTRLRGSYGEVKRREYPEKRDANALSILKTLIKDAELAKRDFQTEIIFSGNQPFNESFLKSHKSEEAKE